MKILNISGPKQDDPPVFELLTNALEDYFNQSLSKKHALESYVQWNREDYNGALRERITIDDMIKEAKEILEKAFDEQEMKNRTLNGKLNLK
jgi:hypothetical protein